MLRLQLPPLPHVPYFTLVVGSRFTGCTAHRLVGCCTVLPRLFAVAHTYTVTPRLRVHTRTHCTVYHCRCPVPHTYAVLVGFNIYRLYVFAVTRLHRVTRAHYLVGSGCSLRLRALHVPTHTRSTLYLPCGYNTHGSAAVTGFTRLLPQFSRVRMPFPAFVLRFCYTPFLLPAVTTHHVATPRWTFTAVTTRLLPRWVGSAGCSATTTHLVAGLHGYAVAVTTRGYSAAVRSLQLGSTGCSATFQLDYCPRSLRLRLPSYRGWLRLFTLLPLRLHTRTLRSRLPFYTTYLLLLRSVPRLPAVTVTVHTFCVRLHVTAFAVVTFGYGCCYHTQFAVYRFVVYLCGLPVLPTVLPGLVISLPTALPALVTVTRTHGLPYVYAPFIYGCGYVRILRITPAVLHCPHGFVYWPLPLPFISTLHAHTVYVYTRYIPLRTFTRLVTCHTAVTFGLPVCSPYRLRGYGCTVAAVRLVAVCILPRLYVPLRFTTLVLPLPAYLAFYF